MKAIRNTIIIVAALVILAAVIYVLAASPFEKNDRLIGGQKDSHGCLAAAGYSWNETEKACVREWSYDSDRYQIVKNLSCNNVSDCVSQCSNGCVNSEWAKTHPDNSECLRAWDCSCENNVCITK
jgi:hypothetical protein